MWMTQRRLTVEPALMYSSLCPEIDTDGTANLSGSFHQIREHLTKKHIVESTRIEPFSPRIV